MSQKPGYAADDVDYIRRRMQEIAAEKAKASGTAAAPTPTPTPAPNNDLYEDWYGGF